MPNVSAEESLLLQCLATTSLLGELSNAKFLTSLDKGTQPFVVCDG